MRYQNRRHLSHRRLSCDRGRLRCCGKSQGTGAISPTPSTFLSPATPAHPDCELFPGQSPRSRPVPPTLPARLVSPRLEPSRGLGASRPWESRRLTRRVILFIRRIVARRQRGNVPAICRVAYGALSRIVVSRPVITVTRTAVGVALMIKVDVRPISGIVAIGALPRIVTGWPVVAVA
jgi:hypothetical protein